MHKFLVIQTAFTGDVVLATAVIEKLHVFFPKAQIDFLVRKGNEGLFEDHPFLNELLIWNKKENKKRNLLILLKKIRSKHYDTVVNLQRFASTGLLTAFSGAKEKIGFRQNPLSFLFTKRYHHDLLSDKHEVTRNQELIKEFTDSHPAKPRLYPTTKDYNGTNQYTHQPYICVMPASVWFTKQYPADKWVDLINNLPATYNIFLLGGKEDTGLCRKITDASENIRIENLSGKLSFLSSAALMQGAIMNYTNDSAPLHFASAVDASVTAVFCSTIPAFGFYPLSSVSHIVETREMLDCRPCSVHGLQACPLGHFKCANSIETSQLLKPILA
jgi:heptosyltransferase-2